MALLPEDTRSRTARESHKVNAPKDSKDTQAGELCRERFCPLPHLDRDTRGKNYTRSTSEPRQSFVQCAEVTCSHLDMKG